MSATHHSVFTFPPMFPSDSLVSYWKLNETSGTSVADSKGSNTGTLTGMTVNQTGKLWQCYLMGAAGTDHIVLANWRPVKNFSINFWVKNNADGGNRIFTEFNAQHTAGGWIIDWGNSSGAGRFGVYSTSLQYYTTTTAGNYWYAWSTWHMVTCVRSTDTSYIYVNGVLDGSLTFGGDVTYDSTDVLSIGGFYNDGPYAQCATVYLDEVSTWSRVLTQADINRLYNGSAGLSYY